MQHVGFHAGHEEVLQGLAVGALRVELGVVLDPERFLALVDEVHEVGLLVQVGGVRVDQLKCLRFLLELLDLRLLLPEQHLGCLLRRFLLALDAHALEELELVVALLELRVYALPHVLQVPDDPHALLHVARTLVLHAGELDVVVGNGDVARVVVEVQGAQVAGRSVDYPLALVQGSLLLALFADFGHHAFFLLLRLALVVLFLFLAVLDVSLRQVFRLFLLVILLVLRTGIVDHFDVGDLIVAESDQVDLSVHSIAAASHIAVKGDVDLIFGLVVSILNGLPAIGNEVRMAGAPRKGWWLGSANITSQLGDFDLGIRSLFPLGHGEQLAVATDLILKSLLELLPRLPELLVVPEVVEVGEHAHHVGEAVALEQREELEGLHFEAQTGVDDQQHDVCYFGQVDHGGDVGRAFDDGDPLLFVAAEGDRACDLVHLVLRVVLYQRADH